MPEQPLNLASVGLGGYGGYMLNEFLKAMEQPAPPLMLTAVCEPDHVLHADRIAMLRSRGIQVFQYLDDLLNEPAEAVWLPLPIDLHRPFTEKVAAAGKIPICEKPAAGCVDDLDAMIVARDRGRVRGAIAFQDIYSDIAQQLKRELVGGAIGPIRGATLHACWPRASAYYRRNAWAGKLQRNGTWVLDSPASNALAHFINLALFLLGPSERVMAEPVTVEAELYRVNPIENYDTCSLRITVAGQIPLLVLLTHACEKTIEPTLRLVGAKGEVRYVMGRQASLKQDGGERIFPVGDDFRQPMLDRLSRWAHGADELVATFEMTRPHVVVVNGASQTTKVHSIDPAYVRTVTREDGDTLQTLPGIEDIFVECAGSGKMLHESGRAPWSTSAAALDVRQYAHFAGVAQ